jgi:hypothetical protein
MICVWVHPGSLCALQLCRAVASRLRRARGASGVSGGGAVMGPRRSEGVWRVPLLWVAALEQGMGDAARAVRVLSMQVRPWSVLSHARVGCRYQSISKWTLK